MNYAIEVRNLTKSYKSFKAVDNLSIGIPEGKIYGFLGRNGAGKTTTIKMMLGLIKPDKGDVLVMGRDIKKEGRWVSNKIGSVVETPGFYENLTAWGNLFITAELYGVDKKRIDEALEIVSLLDVRGKKVREFSMGMKQRLGIANALIHSPCALILDEPTNGLDPAGIKDIRELLRSLCEKKGMTIMISSHILSEVQQTADYVGIIDRGRLIEETDIKALKKEDQQYLLLETDDMASTADILSAMDLSYQAGQECFKVYCKRDINGHINKKLVAGGINVVNLTPVRLNLEERFFSTTEGSLN